jgi:hypothetical protein
MPSEFITHHPENTEDWTCVCGNTVVSDGFFPCDKNGDEMEPLINSDWADLYVCVRCGRIINQHTLTVVGQNPHPILLA